VLDIVVTVLLTAHLLLVDLAMVGPLVCVWLRWSSQRRADAAAEALARRLAVVAAWALAAGSILGGLLLGILYLADDRPYFAALAAIPVDRIWFALAELVFALGCLSAYAALWDRWRRRRVLHPLVALAGATNLLVHFPALFTIISLVSTRRELGAALDRAAYRRLLVDGEVLARVAHVCLAAAALSGVVVALLAVSTREELLPVESRRRLTRFGARLALAATLVQFPVGLWVALAMPETTQSTLLGGDWFATGLFLAALVLAVHLVYVLVAIALGDDERRKVRRSAAVLVVVMLLMVATRLRVSGQAADSPAARPRALASGAGSVSMGRVASGWGKLE
jgi:hypothetical protein